MNARPGTWFRLFLAVAAAAVVAPAAAAEVPGSGFSVRGAGLLDCAAFSRIRSEDEASHAMVGGWIDGYLTAVNRYEADTYDITSFETTELIVKIVAGHCEAHPGHRLYPVIASVVKKLHEQRITEPAALVSVSNGVQRTALYAPTVLRMQARLSEAGLLDGVPTGEFDDATREALMAYQSRLGYKPTGFPDQGTLWHLFSG